MTEDPLKRPLVFGDKEQIEALALLAREKFWEARENCKSCEGDGDCSKCGHPCEDCGTIGKTPEAYARWEKEFPGYATWRSVR